MKHTCLVTRTRIFRIISQILIVSTAIVTSSYKTPKTNQHIHCSSVLNSLEYVDTVYDPIASELKSSLIWNAGISIPDTLPLRESYPVSVGFRKTFTFPEEATSAELHIFADARYLLWINGEYVNRGPNRFNPKRPEYDSHKITKWLKAGSNTIAVLIQSGLSNYRFMYHHAGMTAVMEMKDSKGKVISKIDTDTTWRSSASTRFGPPGALLSGISDNVDEHREKADWLVPEFDDSDWQFAIKTNGSYWGDFSKRMIPLLRETQIEGVQVLSIVQDSDTCENISLLNKTMPLELTAPATVLIDMKQMVRAWFELDFESGRNYYASIDQNREFFPPTVHAAVMALHNGLVPKNRRKAERKNRFLTNN
ncbi:MAG: alpha-L-rhamnosidase N-terminal domain-containing protein [Bacteroidota bacterium]